MTKPEAKFVHSCTAQNTTEGRCIILIHKARLPFSLMHF